MLYSLIRRPDIFQGTVTSDKLYLILLATENTTNFNQYTLRPI